MWRVLPEIHALRGYRALNNQGSPEQLLASLPSRLIAEVLDRLPIWLHIAAYSSTIRMDAVTELSLEAAWLLFLLAWATAAFWLFRRGQTPGKRLMGIRVVKRNGDPASWWRMFARETLIKWFLILYVASKGLELAWPLIYSPGYMSLGLVWFLADLLLNLLPPLLLFILNSFGIVIAVGYLLPLWDRNRRALHDKVMGTAVVSARR